MRLLLLSSSLTLLALTACGDDPVRFSEPVGINLKAKSSDTTNGVVSDEKGITTESGNPYGKFVGDAMAALGGKNPGSVELDHTEILLGAGSTGVTRLGEIFTGDVAVLFIMNDTNNSFPAATVPIAATDGGGPIGVASTFTSDGMGAEDYTKLLNGSFKVVVRGPAAVDFMTKGADADVQVTMTFVAFE
jgi:hypothetical protein